VKVLLISGKSLQQKILQGWNICSLSRTAPRMANHSMRSKQVLLTLQPKFWF